MANGVTVELLGVCEHPSEDKQWWRPDGSTLQEKPYGTIGRDRTFADSDEKAYEFVLRLTGATEVDTKWNAIPKTGGYGTSYPSGNDGKPSPNLRVLHTAFPKNTRKGTIRFAVATSSWKTIAETPAEKSFSAQATQHGGVIFSDVSNSPYGANPPVFSITVTDDILDSPCRIIAITHDGQQTKPIRTTGGSAGNTRQTTAYFETPQIDKGGKTENSFKEFQFQTRPYEWVHFENVSLQPGLKTDVKVRKLSGAKPRSSRSRTTTATKPRTPARGSRTTSTQSTIKAQKENIKEQLAVLNEHRDSLRLDMKTAEDGLQDVRERFKISDLDEHSYPHPITQRLIRLEKQKDDCRLEIAQQRKKVSMLRGHDKKNDRRDAEIQLRMSEEKLKQLQTMVEEAQNQQSDLDRAKSLYKQRLDVRDERKRTLDSIKAKIEKLRLEYDQVGLSPSPPKPAPAINKPVTRGPSSRKIPVYRGPSRTTITDSDEEEAYRRMTGER